MESCRRFPRTELVLRMDFRVSGRNMDRERAYTKILGGGGLMATTSSPLSTGTKVEMNIYHDSFVIPFEARVVWTKPDEIGENRRYQCGFQYLTGSNNGLMHIQYLIQSKLNSQNSNPL